VLNKVPRNEDYLYLTKHHTMKL